MEWISVKDRLPCLDEKVLAINIKNKNWVYPIILDYQRRMVIIFAKKPYRKEVTNFFDLKWDEEPLQVKVTHWMPLPESPKE